MLTVSQFMDGFGARLLAGAEAADGGMRWAHTSELLDPTPFLSGGELLLTNGIQLTDAALQRSYVECLAAQQIAGLGLGTGVNLATVPEPMIEAAERLALPLYEIPYDVPFIAITEKAFRAIADEQNAVLRRSMAAHKRLEQLVLSEAGMDAVAHALAQLVGGTILVFDGRFEPLLESHFVHPLPREDLQAIAGELDERRRSGHQHHFIPRHTELEGRTLALPVPSPRNRGLPDAWLVAAKEGGTLNEFDRLVLGQGATVVAMEFLRRRVARDTEWRLARDLLADLARGAVAGPELARKLVQFGIQDKVVTVMLQRPDGARQAAASEAAMAEVLANEQLTSVTATHRGAIVALVAAVSADTDFPEVAATLQRTASASADETLHVGVSRAYPLEDARRAFHEARCALDAIRLSCGDDSTLVGTHRELGSFRLLLALQDGEELGQFCSSVLGAIDESESTYGDELVRSLEIFLEEGGHWERASARLYCHRHTLRYRMKKVEELTGRKLGSATDRMEFWLALRGRQLFR